MAFSVPIRAFQKWVTSQFADTSGPVSFLAPGGCADMGGPAFYRDPPSTEMSWRLAMNERDSRFVTNVSEGSRRHRYASEAQP
jgi:hypothetical protein